MRYEPCDFVRPVDVEGDPDAAGHAVKVKHGLALVDQAPCAEKPWQAWNRIAEARIAAVIRALKKNGVVVGPSALIIWGVEQWIANPDVWIRVDHRYPSVELPAVVTGGVRVPAVLARQSRVPMPDDTRRIQGIDVDSLENTAVLMALSSHPLEAFVAVCGILRRLSRFDRFSLDESRRREAEVRRRIVARLKKCGRRRGRKRAMRILHLADAACETVAEAALLWVLLSVVPERPRSQYPVDRNGRIYFCDFALPGVRIIIEFDGMAKMGNDEAEFRLRRAELMARQRDIEAQGWRFVRVQWRDFANFTALRTALAREAGVSAGANAIGASIWKPVPPSMNGRQRRSV